MNVLVQIVCVLVVYKYNLFVCLVVCLGRTFEFVFCEVPTWMAVLGLCCVLFDFVFVVRMISMLVCLFRINAALVYMLVYPVVVSLWLDVFIFFVDRTIARRRTCCSSIRRPLLLCHIGVRILFVDRLSGPVACILAPIVHMLSAIVTLRFWRCSVCRLFS